MEMLINQDMKTVTLVAQDSDENSVFTAIVLAGGMSMVEAKVPEDDSGFVSLILKTRFRLGEALKQ